MQNGADSYDVLEKHLQDSLNSLQQSVNGLTESACAAKARGWSITENIEHLMMLEERMIPLLSQGLTEEGEPRDLPDLSQTIATRSTAVDAPSFLHPSGRFTHCAEALAAFTAQRHQTIEFIRTSPRLRGRYRAHPIFGPIDGYQWVLALAAHTKRHVGQIEELKTLFAA